MRSPYDYLGTLVGLALGIVFAVVFYRIGEQDYGKGYMTALASLALTTIMAMGLKSGAIGEVAGQILLFGVLWGYNFWKNEK